MVLGPLGRAFCEPANRDDIISPVLCGPGGAPCLNGAKSYEKWFQGGFLVNSAFPAVAASATVIGSLRAQPSDAGSGDLIISQLLGRWTDRRLAVRLYSQWLDHWYSNVAIPVEVLFGSTNFPSILMGKIFVKSGTGLTAEITDLSGASNTATLMGRGVRTLVPPGGGAQSSIVERFFWEKSRRFRPYFLGPTDGPQVPQSGATALAAAASVTLTFEVPSIGDFYMAHGIVNVVTPLAGAVASQIALTAWTEGGPSNSFVDTNLLATQSTDFFAQSFTGQLNNFGEVFRGGGFGGGWGGDLEANDGQTLHRLHRGTQMFVTLRNDSGVSVRVSLVFVGWLGTCEASVGQQEYLMFPQAMGQVVRPITPRFPGDPVCAPNCPQPPGGSIIIAPQVESGPPVAPSRVQGVGVGRMNGQQW